MPVIHGFESRSRSQNQKEKEMGDTKLEFGKHKGKSLHEVPTGYLEWLAGQMEEDLKKRQELLDAIEEELNQR